MSTNDCINVSEPNLGLEVRIVTTTDSVRKLRISIYRDDILIHSHTYDTVTVVTDTQHYNVRPVFIGSSRSTEAYISLLVCKHSITGNGVVAWYGAFKVSPDNHVETLLSTTGDKTLVTTSLVKRLKEERTRYASNDCYFILCGLFTHSILSGYGRPVTLSNVLDVQSGNHSLCDHGQITEILGLQLMFDRLIDTIDEPLSENLIKDLHIRYTLGLYIAEPEKYKPGVIVNPLETMLNSYNDLSDKSLLQIVKLGVHIDRIMPFDACNGIISRAVVFRECLRNDVCPFCVNAEYMESYFQLVEEPSMRALTNHLQEIKPLQDEFNLWFANYTGSDTTLSEDFARDLLRRLYDTLDPCVIESVVYAVPKSAYKDTATLIYSLSIAYSAYGGK